MIDVKNLSVGYGKTSVLSGASLSLEKGEFVSIIGTNGSGKSTLLKAILGMIEINSGEISVDGEKTAELSRSQIARKIAYLAQGKSVPDMTVGQMVLHGRFPHLGYPRRYSENDRKIAAAALEQTGLSEYKEMPLPVLSGGMRQNAYIAMALAQQTDYVLLDEPTSYLDITHQIRLIKTLRELSDNGKGVAAVMHDLPLAFGFSDKIAVLDEGKIALFDTPENVCESKIIGRIFGVELKYNSDEKYYFYDMKSGF